MSGDIFRQTSMDEKVCITQYEQKEYDACSWENEEFGKDLKTYIMLCDNMFKFHYKFNQKVNCHNPTQHNPKLHRPYFLRNQTTPQTTKPKPTHTFSQLLHNSIRFSMQPCFNPTRRFTPKKWGHLIPPTFSKINSIQQNKLQLNSIQL